MQQRSGHTSYVESRPVSPLRAIIGVSVGLAVAIVLYFTIGRAGEPIPDWISLPTGASVKVSAAPPPDQEQSPVRYYLRFRHSGDPMATLVQLSAGVKDAAWESGSPRPTTRDDLGVRAAWPDWVRRNLYRVPDVSAGRTMTSRKPNERLFLYAWPIQDGCMIELVQDAPAMQSTPDSTNEPER